ncbi:hypothetical protein SSS_10320, partial [Sarcoptes scabiei]
MNLQNEDVEPSQKSDVFNPIEKNDRIGAKSPDELDKTSSKHFESQSEMKQRQPTDAFCEDNLMSSIDFVSDLADDVTENDFNLDDSDIFMSFCGNISKTKPENFDCENQIKYVSKETLNSQSNPPNDAESLDSFEYYMNDS